jgi:segregation and condensation protein A
LYRQQSILFEQPDALEQLTVTWAGGSVQEARAASASDMATQEEDEEYE